MQFALPTIDETAGCDGWMEKGISFDLNPATKSKEKDSAQSDPKVDQHPVNVDSSQSSQVI
jgi:hypothetical protein